MHTTCRKWIVGILESHLPVVAIAARQRAKFEGWLKFELAKAIEEAGANNLQVESRYEGSGARSDISFCFDGAPYDLELKTPNTNWRMPGVLNLTRPITMNVASIVKDARKLQTCRGQGIVAFALFPIPVGDGRWREYLERIGSELDTSLSEQEHVSRVTVPLGEGRACEIVVCCFLYTTNPEFLVSAQKWWARWTSRGEGAGGWRIMRYLFNRSLEGGPHEPLPHRDPTDRRRHPTGTGNR